MLNVDEVFSAVDQPNEMSYQNMKPSSSVLFGINQETNNSLDDDESSDARTEELSGINQRGMSCAMNNFDFDVGLRIDSNFRRSSVNMQLFRSEAIFQQEPEQLEEEDDFFLNND